MSLPHRLSTDPQIYSVHIQKFLTHGIPQDANEWRVRAHEVGQVFAADASTRDIENKSTRAEIALLKSSGLLKVLGLKKYGGGGGQSWDVGYKVIREVAKGDGSLGMLLGYHLLWSTTANVVGTNEQKERFQEFIIENNYFVGGAVNPRDSDLKITSSGDYIIFNGFKNFNIGGVISDLTVLEGVYEGTEAHIFTIVPTEQAGTQFKHNWNNVGLRLTESGGVKIDNVRVPWNDAFGWDPEKQIIESVLKIPFAMLLLPTIQLVFSNFYLGIAVGALETAAKYTVANTRAWPYVGDNKERATDEFYILERCGNFKARLRVAEALADHARTAVAGVYAKHCEARDMSPRAPGDLVEWVASVKIVTTDIGFRVTSGIFEVLGARATARTLGFDRFWRYIRTHSLYDPVAYKNRELGSYALLDEFQNPLGARNWIIYLLIRQKSRASLSMPDWIIFIV